jgi:glutamate 5-kinase
VTGAQQRAAAARARRIVVKVGSSILTDAGRVRPQVFSQIARQVATLVREGRQVVVVTSGAIALGSRALGWDRPGRSIPEMQAAAAVGQIDLVETYRRRFARHDLRVAQVLVTRHGLEDRERYLNARNTLDTLLRLGVVPVVNENDTVATEEIRFGDNDNLSATVVSLVDGDLLVLLTDVDGLYRRAPEPGRRQPPLFDVVSSIDAAVEQAAGGSGHAFGRGGMITKLQAARTAARAGAATVICNGRKRDVLLRVAAGEPVGTLFLAGPRLRGRKHWLAYTKRPRGEIVVDAGAARALVERGRSLLPAGIAGVRGQFGVGDAVTCVDVHGRELARGLTAYSSEEVARIQGLPTRKIAQVLGYSNGDAVIHRDRLVVLESAPEAPGNAAR